MRYFAYGTTQQGYFNHRELGLGEPVARLHIYNAHSIVVPRFLACSNPGCRYLHRMAVLVAGTKNFHPEGDVFAIDEAMLTKLDALELAGPYERVELTLSDGSTAFTYRAERPLPWLNRVTEGLADEVESFTDNAEPKLKPCCLADPDHAGPHDVIDPLDELLYAEARLRNHVRHFSSGASTNLHILEATAATTPYEIRLAAYVTVAISRHREDREALRARLAQLLEEFPAQTH